MLTPALRRALFVVLGLAVVFGIILVIGHAQPSTDQPNPTQSDGLGMPAPLPPASIATIVNNALADERKALGSTADAFMVQRVQATTQLCNQSVAQYSAATSFQERNDASAGINACLQQIAEDRRLDLNHAANSSADTSTAAPSSSP